MARMIAEYEAALPPGGWPNWVLGNHDRPRIATRVGAAQARAAAVLLLTLRGTPTIYYGDEIGMTDVAIPPARAVDPRELREPGLGLGRDPVRTPMPWNDSAQAGFSTADPWLPLGDDWRTCNVAAQAGDARSMLALYRALLALRRKHAALAVGAIDLIPATDGVLAYRRRCGDERIVVMLNMGEKDRVVDRPAGTLLLSTHAGDAIPDVLRAGEAHVILLPPDR